MLFDYLIDHCIDFNVSCNVIEHSCEFEIWFGSPMIEHVLECSPNHISKDTVVMAV